MKTYRNLYPQIVPVSKTCIGLTGLPAKASAAKQRSRGFERSQEEELFALARRSCRNQTYTPGRLSQLLHPRAQAPPDLGRAFPRPGGAPRPVPGDRADLGARASSHDCYANRIGKGTHRALDRAQEYCPPLPLRSAMRCRASSFPPSIMQSCAQNWRA